MGTADRQKESAQDEPVGWLVGSVACMASERTDADHGAFGLQGFFSCCHAWIYLFLFFGVAFVSLFFVCCGSSGVDVSR